MSHPRPTGVILQPPTMLRRDFVRELSPATLAGLESIRTRYHVPAGEVLFSQGEHATRVIEIASGSVKLWLDQPQQQTLMLRLVRAGELLGLREVVVGSGYAVNASAVNAVEYFSIPRKGFLDLLHKHFDAGFAVTRLLSAELSSAHETLRSMVASAAPSKEHRRRATGF